ncbi:MAG TPA: hypothetical protein VF221_04365 [Chloroflexota bacterium]
MTTSRDELRESLVAAIEAAPELPKENREHLADIFLDRLNAEYDLVPRGPGRRPQPARPAGGAAWGKPWVPIALVLAFLVFVLPAVVHHFPIFLLVLVAVFFIVKRVRRGRSSTVASG